MGQLFPVIVEHLQRGIGRGVDLDPVKIVTLEQQVTDPAHDRRGQRPRRAHNTDPTTNRTADHGGIEHGRTNTLTRQLQQAEGRNPPQLNAGTVTTHGFLEPALDLPPVTRFIHVDEVDHHQSGKIAQTQLPGHFLSGLKVGRQCCLLDRTLAGRLARVDVDRDQRLGLVQHQIAAGFEGHHGVEQCVELLLSLMPLEQRRAFIFELLNPLGMRRGQCLHEALGVFVALVTLDQHFFHIAGIHVADCTLHHVGFFVDQRRGHGVERGFADPVPGPAQVLVVALDLSLGPLATGRPDDDRNILWQIQIIKDGLEPATVLGRGNLAGDASAPGRVRHVNAVATGEREVGAQGRALVAALFLGHLNQHHLSALDHLLDRVAAGDDRVHDRATLGVFIEHILVVIIVIDVVVIVLIVVVVIVVAV